MAYKLNMSFGNSATYHTLDPITKQADVTYAPDRFSIYGWKQAPSFEWSNGSSPVYFTKNGKRIVFEVRRSNKGLPSMLTIQFEDFKTLRDFEQYKEADFGDLGILLQVSDSTSIPGAKHLQISKYRDNLGNVVPTNFSEHIDPQVYVSIGAGTNRFAIPNLKWTNSTSTDWLQFEYLFNEPANGALYVFSQSMYGSQTVMCDMAYPIQNPQGTLNNGYCITKPGYRSQFLMAPGKTYYVPGPVATVDGKKYQTYGILSNQDYDVYNGSSIIDKTIDYVGIAVTKSSIDKGEIKYTDPVTGDTATIYFKHGGVASRTDAHRIDVASQISNVRVHYVTKGNSKNIFSTEFMLGVKSNIYSRTIFFASANIMSYTVMAAVGDAINQANYSLGDAPMAPGPSLVLQEFVTPYVGITINNKFIGTVEAKLSGSTMSFKLPDEYYVGKNVNYDRWPYTEFKSKN